MPRLTDEQIQELIDAGKGEGGTLHQVWLDDKTPYYCWDCKELFYVSFAKSMALEYVQASSIMPLPMNVIKRECPKCGTSVSPLAYEKEYPDSIPEFEFGNFDFGFPLKDDIRHKKDTEVNSNG